MGILGLGRKKKVEVEEIAEPVVVEEEPTGPALMLLVPEVAGGTSFRALKFRGVSAAAEHLAGMIPAAVPGVHAFWAMLEKPGEASHGGEALVLIRTQEDGDLVYVVSFVDIESALSFARFEVKRGMSPGMLMVYWAELVEIQVTEEGIWLTPDSPPDPADAAWTASVEHQPEPVAEAAAPPVEAGAELVAEVVEPERQGGTTTNWVRHEPVEETQEAPPPVEAPPAIEEPVVASDVAPPAAVSDEFAPDPDEVVRADEFEAEEMTAGSNVDAADEEPEFPLEPEVSTITEEMDANEVEPELPEPEVFPEPVPEPVEVGPEPATGVEELDFATQLAQPVGEVEVAPTPEPVDSVAEAVVQEPVPEPQFSLDPLSAKKEPEPEAELEPELSPETLEVSDEVEAEHSAEAMEDELPPVEAPKEDVVELEATRVDPFVYKTAEEGPVAELPEESPEQIEGTLTDESDAAADLNDAEVDELEVEIHEEPEPESEPEPVLEETPAEVPVAEEEPVEELETSVEVVAEVEADQAPEEMPELEPEPVLEETPAEVPVAEEEPVEDVDAPVDVAAEVETDEAPEEVPLLEPEPVLEETPDDVPVAEEEPAEEVEAPAEVVAEAEAADAPEEVPVLEPDTEVEVESPEAVDPAPELDAAAEEVLAAELEPEPVAEMTDEVAVEAEDDEPEPFESSPMDAELTEDTTEDYTFEEDEPVIASPPGFLREDGTDEPVEEWVDEPFSPQTQFEVTEDEETAEELVLDSDEWNETPVEQAADSAFDETVSVGRNGHSNDGAVDNENPPETIPGEEDLSPEMAAFLKARRRVAKDNPFKGFDSPPGRF